MVENEDATDPLPMLEMQGICKRYGAVRAIENLDLSVARAQIIGLLGENGSGKSTLMKILFGMVRPDAGTIRFKGVLLTGHSPRDAIRAGIAMIHQHFMLVDAMTVTENIILSLGSAGRRLRRREVARLVRETSERYGLDLDPYAQVGNLSLGRRQRLDDLNALLHPGTVFDRPRDVVAHPSLSISEKRAILASWASDASAIASCPSLRAPAGLRAPIGIDEIRHPPGGKPNRLRSTSRALAA